MTDDAHGLEASAYVGELALAVIRVDPSKNYSRGGVVDGPGHPKTQRLIESMRVDGLLHGVGVRALEPALLRSEEELAADPDGPTHFSHELIYGYRRDTGARALGWKSIAVRSYGVISDREARKLNILENLIRDNPTDYEEASALALLVQDSITFTDLAREFHTRANYIEQRVRIITRCPKEILEQWRMSPTPEYRRALEKISRIEAETELETHRKMLEAWAQFLRDREELTAPELRERSTKKRAPRAMGTGEIEELRAKIDQASEVHDASGWRSLVESERALAQAILRHVQNPRANKIPFR